MRKGMMLAGALLISAAVPANAALVGDFQFNGNLTNAAGGSLTLTNNGATLGATGLTFAANDGPTITGFSTPSDYSVATRFRFNSTNGYRKILDFFSRASDSGLYVIDDYLQFYPVETGSSPVFSAGQFATLVFTRDSGGNATAYVNGVNQFTFTNAVETTIVSDLDLFRDDFSTGGFESSDGFVDYIQIYDTALTAGEVAGLGGAIPEPAAWALMISGFGLIGAASRRRRLAVAYLTRSHWLRRSTQRPGRG